MHWLRGLILLWMVASCAGAQQFEFPGATSPLGRQRAVRARLFLSHETAKPGDTVLAGIELKMSPGWHTYWRNPGDSGQATEIHWALTNGISAGEIQWPVPEKLFESAAALTTYIHHDRAVLLVPLKIANDAAAGDRDLSALVKWLECEKSCVPGSNMVQATFTIGKESKLSDDTNFFAEAQKRLPSKQVPGTVVAKWDGGGTSTNRALVIEWNTSAAEPDFFPFTNAPASFSGPTSVQTNSNGKVVLRKTAEKKRNDSWPREIAGLLVRKESDSLAGYETTLQPANSEAGGVAEAYGGKDSKPLWLWFIYGLIGGLILNVMPCVLPVIALKILGFVNQSREAPGRVRQFGLLYALGVLVSFAVMAGFVIGVGKSASWGMQFQNAKFLVGITTLVTLVALNLFGVFEVTLSGGAMSAAGHLAAKEGSAGAFFNGVLAVVLATPCTAPFLGAAVGFAFTQPPTIIMLMFLAVGVGLALPYVILSWSPKLMKFMPRPGAWMEKFKIAMGFPMLGAAIWLYALAIPHFGKKGAFWLGMFLVFIALAAWIWGEFIQRGQRRKALAAGAALLSLAAGAYGLTQMKGEQWQPWSAEAVAKARAAGHPVFVDFTADWCAICKANERTSINVPSVREKLKEVDAVTLIADYTMKDDVIATEFRKYGRAAVPLVLVFPKDATKPPIVLPELLTPGIVLKALDEATK